jgi:hypothetical protein
MSETLMMIEPILSTGPVFQGTRLAGLSIGWQRVTASTRTGGVTMLGW